MFFHTGLFGQDMETAWELLLAGLLTLWLSKVLEVPQGWGHPGVGKTEDTRFVVAFGRKHREIFCLGAIIGPRMILTLASCFEEEESTEELKYDDDYHERRRRRARNASTVLRSMRKNMLRESLDGYEDGIGNDTSTDKPSDEDDSEESDSEEEEEEEEEEEQEQDDDEDEDDYLDYEGPTPPPEPYSLYRIEPILKVFVKLAAETKSMMYHPDYAKIQNLWKYDIMMVTTTIPFDFKRKTVRFIGVYIINFGNYMKSLNEAMMNAEDCHVIGLVEYSDNGSYTPRDTDVQLISHPVLLDFQLCNTSYCDDSHQNRSHNCQGIGHHIFKDPVDPLPCVVPGSPLVCRGLLMSFVNMWSHCDDTRFSGEFPSPKTINSFFGWLDAGNMSLLKETKPNSTFPSIPFPRWRISGDQATSPRASALMLVALISLRVHVNDRTF